jgi:hypothetical protein
MDRPTALRALAGTSLMMAALSMAPRRAAADPPKFEFAAPQEEPQKKKVEWKASAQGGIVFTSGNSNTLTVSVGALASYFDGKNKVTFDLSGAFGRSKILIASDDNKDGAIEPNEINTLDKVTTRLWNIKLRYDRFITKKNSLYAATFVGGDEAAGKHVWAGAQGGYARQLYKSDRHELALELGYDFSFVDYLDGTSVNIHSARLFAGYTLTIRSDTQLALSCEVLENLNPLDSAVGHAGPFVDVRVIGKASLTTKLWKALSFRVSFTARFDNFPAPLPTFTINGMSVPYSAGFTPVAEKLDTLTEVSLIVSFL